jgi:hypothetical protein
MNTARRVFVVTGASQGTLPGLVAGYREVGLRVVATSRSLPTSTDQHPPRRATRLPMRRASWTALFMVGAGLVAACDEAKPAPQAAEQPAFQPAPPISGVLGKITAVAANSFDVQTKAGLAHVQTGGDLTTYRQAPSDLSHVTPSSFVGVPSVGQGNGTEVAKLVMIFPPELRGAAEGSVLLDDPPGATARNRMTNGSVSASPSRMTNGTVQNGDGRTLVVQYQDGAQTISVPPNTPVTEIKPDRVTLEAGDVVYAATTTQPSGALTTNKVFVFISARTPG